MKVYLFKDEILKLGIADPTVFSDYEGDYRVFQMEKTVTKLQPCNPDDPAQNQLCKDLMEKPFPTVESGHGSAKKRRIERNPSLTISMGLVNNVSASGTDDHNNPIISILGEVIPALHELRLSVPRADVGVKLTLLTDIKGPIGSERNFSVSSGEIEISKDSDSPAYSRFSFHMPDIVRNTIMSYTDGKQIIKIGGKFTIEISLHNFEETFLTPKALTQTILNDVESSDVIICTGDGKEVPCHRVFLAVNSTVLKAMLRSNFTESSTGKIEMPDMSEKGVKAFLAYLYYRDLAPAKEKISIAWELLYAGDKYSVIPLRTLIERLLLEADEDSWWTVEAALKIFSFMDKIDSGLKENVKRKIVGVMKRNSSEWMSSKVYQKVQRWDPALISELLKASFSLDS